MLNNIVLNNVRVDNQSEIRQWKNSACFCKNVNVVWSIRHLTTELDVNAAFLQHYLNLIILRGYCIKQ